MTALESTAAQIISLQSASCDGYALRAFSFTKRKNFARAEPDVRQAISLAPNSPTGYMQMGNLRFAQQRYPDAENAYQKALEKDPNAVEALQGLADSYRAENQSAKAIAALRVQIAKVPNNSAFYDLLGTALFQQQSDSGDLSEAEGALRKAIQLNPHNADALFKLEQVQSAVGATDEALAVCQRAAVEDPHEASVYLLAGRLHESKKDWKSASDDYQKALAAEPDNGLAANNLAYLLIQEGGNLDVALSLAQAARRRMPTSHNVADTLGWVLYQKGVYSAAIGMFQESLKLAQKNGESEDPTVHYHLGLTYQKTGQASLARQHLERVLKINPNYASRADVEKLLSELHG
jgi:tetratricopeptide (TPR) repeat protein